MSIAHRDLTLRVRALAQKVFRSAERGVLLSRLLHEDACRIMLSAYFNPNDSLTPTTKARVYRGQSVHEGKSLVWRPECFLETRPPLDPAARLLSRRDLGILSSFDIDERQRFFNESSTRTQRIPSLLEKSSRTASSLPANESSLDASQHGGTSLKRKKTFSMFTEAEQRLNAWTPQPTLIRMWEMLQGPPIPLRVTGRGSSPRGQGATDVAPTTPEASSMSLPPPGLFRHATLPSLDECRIPTQRPRQAAAPAEPTISRGPSSKRPVVHATTPPGRIRPTRKTNQSDAPHSTTPTAHAHTPPPAMRHPGFKSQATALPATTTPPQRQQLLLQAAATTSSSTPTRVPGRNTAGVSNRGTDSLPPLSQWALRSMK